jgi:hypothetical protein
LVITLSYGALQAEYRVFTRSVPPFCAYLAGVPLALFDADQCPYGDEKNYEGVSDSPCRAAADEHTSAINLEMTMEQILINLIAGALGGVGAGKSSPTFDLGTVGNVISGLVGGGILGQIITLLLPSIMAAAQSGNLSIGGVVSQVVAGGAGGAILTALIGAIKNKAVA